MQTNKLIVIVGPTASGKSDLAVKLARKFSGEVISADSRQVYRGLNIGSGKITKKEMMGIPHHLLGVASPQRSFTVAQYQKRTFQAIASILRRHKLPILVGGSSFYIYAVIDGIVIPEVKPNTKLRKELEKLSVGQLFEKLKKLDPQRAKTVEQKNKRRLVRALEIVMTTGKPVPKLTRVTPPFDMLIIGVRRSPGELKKRIQKRLLNRLNHGMVSEVRRLHNPPTGKGLSWKRLEEFGLEYRFVAQYLQKKISKQEMLDQIQKASEHFVRRQMTWFKKDKRIHWIQGHSEAQQTVAHFLRS